MEGEGEGEGRVVGRCTVGRWRLWNGMEWPEGLLRCACEVVNAKLADESKFYSDMFGLSCIAVAVCASSLCVDLFGNHSVPLRGTWWLLKRAQRGRSRATWSSSTATVWHNSTLTRTALACLGYQPCELPIASTNLVIGSLRSHQTSAAPPCCRFFLCLGFM